MGLTVRVLFVVLLSFVSSNALAQTKIMLMPVVPVGDGVSQEAADKMYQAIREELEERPGVIVLDGKYPKSRTRGTARRGRTRQAAKSLDMATDRLDEGRRQSQKMRFARALKPLEDALAIFAQNIDKLENHESVVEAHLLLAEAYLRRGKQRDGVAVVERLLTLMPALELDPRDYPPMFLGLVEKARKKIAKLQRGVLRVTQSGQREQVYLNGRLMGRTPLRVEAVVPGEHHVRVTSAGRAAWGLKVTVRSGEESVVEDPEAARVVKAGGVLETIGDNLFDRSVRESVRKVARKRGADFVVVTGMGAKMGLLSCAGFLGDVRGRSWSQIRTVSPDMDLLSAGIEAGTFVTSITGLVKKPGPGVRSEEVTFVAGLAGPGGARSMPEKRVTFVTEEQIAAAIKASAPRRVAPVVAKRPELDPTNPPTKVELLSEEEFAKKAGLTKLDLHAGLEEETGVLGEWWFWTSVGVSVAAVVTAVLVTAEGEPTGVMVRASW